MFRSPRANAVTRPPAFYIVAAIIFIILISGIDYFTGPGVIVVFLYFIPIYVVTWNVSLKAGVIAALIASVGDYLADFQQAQSAAILLWNTGVRFCVFFGFCYLLTDRRIAEKELRETENRLFQLLEALPVGVFVVDSKGYPFYSNRTAVQIFGIDLSPNISPEQRPRALCAYKKGTNELYPPDALPIAHALKGQKTFADDIEIHREGRIIPLHAQAVPIYNPEGEIEFAVAAFSDVSEMRTIQEALIENKKNLEESVLFLKEKNQEIGFLNEMVDLLQSSSADQEVYKIATRYVERFLENSSGALYRMKESKNLLEPKITWGKHQNENAFAPEDCWALRRAQIYFTDAADSLRCNHVPVEQTDTIGCIPMIAAGQIVGMVNFSTSSSIDALHKKSSTLKAFAEQVGMTLANLKLRETLRAQAIRDPLTGLFNRRYLEETLDRELSRAKRKDRPLSLIMLDVDHFKRFNDQYGHPAGDELLNSLGKILLTRGRRDDIVCRYGGEEFMLILPECAMEDAGRIAENIRLDAMTLWVQSQESEPTVSISAGVSSYPENGDSSRTLIAAADRALYQAKASGRNRVIFCTEFTG